MNQEYKIYKITYFLMAVNVIAYLYTSLKYGLSMSAMQGIQVGGFNPLYVYYYHEYYRLITANFIHFGLMHIFCNVYSLYNLGMLMEKILKEKTPDLSLLDSLHYDNTPPIDSKGNEVIYDNKKHHLDSQQYQHQKAGRKKNSN